MHLLLHLLLLATPVAAAPERVAVLAVHDPPAPDGELTELTHQLRAASVERLAGVLTAPEMRDRLAGKSGGATAQELDRAFGGALAVYQAGEAESAARTLRAIIEDLEDLPEGEAVWGQWTRAMLRLSHVHLSLRQEEERDAVQVALLKVDPGHQLDPVLYAPGFRAHFEALRQKVRAMPKRRLTVTARGRGGAIYVSGRDVGPTPATVILPAGTYRVAGAAGALRIPSFEVDLSSEDRSVVLDFALAETFRPGAGPGMVLPTADRAAPVIRAGAWLGVEKLVVASRGSEGGAHFLVGAIYDVRRGALLREGSVRMISGGVPASNLGALAAFLLTGQSSREVQDRTREPQGRAAPRSQAAP
ncbi:MAG: PEGA domain-containing protein, partial [Anaeromyxobacteraceae bacterium]|nr:PEGA domain-containing protein [Anaeromyxobacteraceae bacterium]